MEGLKKERRHIDPRWKVYGLMVYDENEGKDIVVNVVRAVSLEQAWKIFSEMKGEKLDKNIYDVVSLTRSRNEIIDSNVADIIKMGQEFLKQKKNEESARKEKIEKQCALFPTLAKTLLEGKK